MSLSCIYLLCPAYLVLKKTYGKTIASQQDHTFVLIDQCNELLIYDLRNRSIDDWRGLDVMSSNWQPEHYGEKVHCPMHILPLKKKQCPTGTGTRPPSNIFFQYPTHLPNLIQFGKLSRGHHHLLCWQELMTHRRESGYMEEVRSYYL